jgi:hypothetical protein
MFKERSCDPTDSKRGEHTQHSDESVIIIEVIETERYQYE